MVTMQLVDWIWLINSKFKIFIRLWRPEKFNFSFKNHFDWHDIENVLFQCANKKKFNFVLWKRLSEIIIILNAHKIFSNKIIKRRANKFQTLKRYTNNNLLLNSRLFISLNWIHCNLMFALTFVVIALMAYAMQIPFCVRINLKKPYKWCELTRNVENRSSMRDFLSKSSIFSQNTRGKSIKGKKLKWNSNQSKYKYIYIYTFGFQRLK